MRRVLCVVVMLVLAFNTNASAASVEQISKTPKMPADATPVEIYPGLTMLYWSIEGYDEFSGPQFVGEARWDGASTIDAPGISVAVLDKDDNVLASETVTAVQYIADPGKRIAYDEGLYDVDELSYQEMDHVQITACADTGDTYFAEQLVADLSVKRVTVREESSSRLSLTVDVLNQGKTPTDYAAALVLVYDGQGHLVTTSQDNVGATVNPEKFGRVSVSLDPGLENYQYRVLAVEAMFAKVTFC
jgi:hypothetical protein